MRRKSLNPFAHRRVLVPSRRTRPARRNRRRLRLESLEDRRLLATTATLMGGELLINDDGGIDNDYSLSLSGGTYTLSDPGNPIDVSSIMGAMGSGTDSVTIPETGITEITIDGNAGDDSVTIDYTLDNPIPTGGIAFNGGGNASTNPGDQLILSGGSATNVTYTFDNANDGSVSIDGSVITYTGLEPISSTITASIVELNYGGTGETITVTDAGAGQTTVNSTAGEMTTFNNPSDVLDISAGGGDDTINVDSLAADYPASFFLDGDSGDDTVNVNGDLLLSDNEDIDFEANTINVVANIETQGAGEISLSAEGSIEVMAAVIAAEDGEISLVADGGGGAGTGILVSDSEVVTDAGNIFMDGSSGSSGDGVYVDNSSIETTSGGIEIDGQSGTGDGIALVGSEITSVDGSIELLGDTTDTSSSSEGVSLDAASIETEGDDIDIDGRSDGGDGIAIQNGSDLENVSGDIFLSGDGAAAGISVDNSAVFNFDGAISVDGVGDENGIEVTNDAAVETETGLISIDGLTNNPGSGAGLYMAVNEPSIRTDMGGIEVLADDDVVMCDDAQIVSESGDVTVEADGDLVMEDAAEIRAVNVDVDADDDVAMSDQSRIFGDGGIAQVVADGDVFVATIAAASEVRVGAGGSIIDNSDSDIDITSVGVAELRASAGIGDGDALETDIPTLAAENTVGNIEIDNSESGAILEIGATMDVTGVTVSGTGDIRLTAFDLDVTEAITAGDGDVELFSSNSTRTFALGSGPAVKGSGLTTGNAAFGLDDAELDLITASGARRVIGDGSADQFNVNYDGTDTQALDVLGEDGEDEFFVAPSETMPLNLDGGTPSMPALPGDTLHLDMTGAAPVVIVDTIGGFAISESTAVISFQEFETLDLCDDSGEIDNADIGDLYVRSRDTSERIVFTLWNDGGVKLRVDDLDAGTSTTYPQHFGLVGGVQMLEELLVYAQGGDDYVTVAGHVRDGNDDPIPTTFFGEDGNDYLAGGRGDDVLVGGPGDDRVLGGEGDNQLFGDGNEFDMNGALIEEDTDGDDRLAGRDGNDMLWGGGGDDRLSGSAGDDVLNAGSGDDFVDGGDGVDILRGEDGNDVMSGSRGDDILLGGAGDDRLFGRDGNDILIGGTGADELTGNDGDDLLVAGTTDQDSDNDAALLALLDTWSMGNPNPLTGITGDGDEDSLNGGTGMDEFWAEILPEPPIDDVEDAEMGESVNNEA